MRNRIEIHILDDGRVVFGDLPPELAAVAAVLQGEQVAVVAQQPGDELGAGPEAALGANRQSSAISAIVSAPITLVGPVVADLAPTNVKRPLLRNSK